MKSPGKNNVKEEKQNSEGVRKLLSSPRKKNLALNKFKKEADDFLSSDDNESPRKLMTSVKKNSPMKKLTSPLKKQSPKKELKGPDVMVNMKPLGFDKELQSWIQNVKSNPVISETPVSFSLLRKIPLPPFFLFLSIFFLLSKLKKFIFVVNFNNFPHIFRRIDKI